MAIELIMPALGMAQETGVVVRWLKNEGEWIKEGEPVMEIETDKATVEIESPATGFLSDIVAEEGEEIPVGERVAWILAEGEETPSERALGSQEGKKSEDKMIVQDAQENSSIENLPLKITPVAKRLIESMKLDVSKIIPLNGKISKKEVLAYLEVQQTGNQSATLARTVASPKARRLMSTKGIDPSLIMGTGPEGAIIEKDVLAYEMRKQEKDFPSAPAALQTAINQVERNEIPISQTWKLMAERTTQSWMNAPHFYLMRDVDVSQLIKWRESFAKRTEQKITYTDLLIRIVAESLRIHPRVNAIWDSGTLYQQEEINIAIAVAIPDGLVAPVIKNADQKDVVEIASKREELVEKARNHKLSLDEIRAGSITISNLGMFGIDVFTAIINAPQPAILAVGRIKEKAVVVNREVVIRPLMTLSLSCDHRVVDGALGAEFLDTISNFIEEPLILLD